MRITAATAQHAAEELGVGLEGLTQETLTAAFHTAAKKHHPDAGGDVALFQRVQQAHATLAGWLAAAAQARAPSPSTASNTEELGDCRACGGTGRIQRRSVTFGPGKTMFCMMCSGSGWSIKRDR